MTESVAFLGPEGTFTEVAARELFESAELTAAATAEAAAGRVRAGDATAAVLPFDNSVNGIVVPTIDLLLGEPGLWITDDTVRLVRFNAYVRDRSARPHTVVSHPHALAQCRRFVASLGPETRVREVESTAEACRSLGTGEVALASPGQEGRFDVTLFRAQVQDHERAATQFVAVSAEPPVATRRTQRSVVLFSPSAHGRGVILQVLGVLTELGLNLANLMTRPVPDEPNHFLFVLFVDIDRGDAQVRELLTSLERLGVGDVRELGRLTKTLADGH
ncbi:prephenate dehydratase [Mariniluteicoccus flavus]